MTLYADPQKCPDCRGPIQYDAGTSCPTCGLSLRGDTARRLFEALTLADSLLDKLRAERPAVAPTEAAAPVVAAPVTSAPPVARQPGPAARATSGLSAASVPKILLGLGAVCLLIAALVFLAVTWSAMGVAGRTTTLVAFTLVAGGLAAYLARKDLRAGAESLAVVTLGLLALDLLGARDSGWFGDISGPGFLVLQGAVIAILATASGLAVRRTPVPRLVGAEIVAATGVALVAIGIVSGDWFAESAAQVLCVVLTAAATALAYHVRLRTAAAATAVLTGSFWAALTMSSAVRALTNPTGPELWGELEVWPLLVSAVMVGSLAFVALLPTGARVAAAATAQLILAFAALLPFTRDGITEATIAVLVVLVLAAAAAWFAPSLWSRASSVTVVVGASWMGLVALNLLSAALRRGADTGSALWSGSATERLPEVYAGGPAPWLLPITVLALFGTVAVVAHVFPAAARMLTRVTDLTIVAPVTLAAIVGMAALYPSPVWLITGVAVLAAAALIGWSLAVGSLSVLATGSVLLASALVIGLVDETTTALALTATIVLTGVLLLRWPAAPVRVTAGVCFAGGVAGSFWTWGAILDRAEPWTALVAIVVLGALVLGMTYRPATVGAARVGIEGGASFAALMLALAGTSSAAYVDQASWVAVYLTATGVFASALALLGKDRRPVGWVGGLLLAAATWVRLYDIEVKVPEAYTLPSAIALTLVGLVHLHRNPGSSTMKALSSGLSLGLFPSLLWVLRDPETLRSVILGIACMVILMAGLRLRWTAPVVFAATVGAVLVLRHVAPVSGAVPQWVLIGSAGALLVGLGITWERRLQEGRAVVGYMRALR